MAVACGVWLLPCVACGESPQASPPPAVLAPQLHCQSNDPPTVMIRPIFPRLSTLTPLQTVCLLHTTWLSAIALLAVWLSANFPSSADPGAERVDGLQGGPGTQEVWRPIPQPLCASRPQECQGVRLCAAWHAEVSAGRQSTGPSAGMLPCRVPAPTGSACLCTGRVGCPSLPT